MAGKPKILIVDDDRNTIQTLNDLLGEYGYDIESAINGSQAIQKIEKQPPDIVLLDTRLPGMDGYTVCEKIRSISGSSIKIVLYTAYADLVDVSRAKAVGADEYISKTEDFSNLLRILNMLGNPKYKLSKGLTSQ